jgi:hypothetical protein
MNLMWGTPLQSQLNDLLNNLEVTYLDLVGGQLWSGVTATPHHSFFLAGNIDDDTEFKDIQAMAAKINLPWDEWVKLYAKCHHCGDVGNIHPQWSGWARSSTQMELITQALVACLLHVLPIAPPPYVATIL